MFVSYTSETFNETFHWSTTGLHEVEESPSDVSHRKKHTPGKPLSILS